MFLIKRAPQCRHYNSHYVGINNEIYETCESCMKRNMLVYHNAVVNILRKLVFLKDLAELITSLSSLKFEKVQFGLWDQLIAVMPLLSHYTILNNCTLENETFQEGSKVLEIKRLCVDTSM